MAQDEHQSLIAWLSANKLNFMKDALVEEDYTLDMIVSMTDDDMNGIFQDLKISNIKRPRFRNAVQSLKQKKQNKINPVVTVSTTNTNTNTSLIMKQIPKITTVMVVSTKMMCCKMIVSLHSHYKCNSMMVRQMTA